MIQLVINKKKLIFDDFIYFICIFILLTHRKAMEVLICRKSNYPNLLPKMPSYSVYLKIFILNFKFYREGLKFRTACKDYQAGESVIKCFFQGHNRMAQLGFEMRPCQSQL